MERGKFLIEMIFISKRVFSIIHFENRTFWRTLFGFLQSQGSSTWLSFFIREKLIWSEMRRTFLFVRWWPRWSPKLRFFVVAIEKVAHLADVIETVRHRLEVETETKVVRLYSVAVVTVLPRLVKTEKVVVHRMDVIGTVPHLLAMIEKVHLLTVMK
jgi:hypothetical protein